MLSIFSQNYESARSLLLSVAETNGSWHHEAYKHPQAGLEGNPIYTDVLRRGPKDASRILVISSGTHGVEGFCGSAIQSQFVKDNPVLPDDLAVVLIHAINPFGFSHLRRVTEDNVDLNRNFVNFDSDQLENEAYRKLDSLLNPVELPAGAIEKIVQKLLELQNSMDFVTFFKAVSGGQYEFPRGVQFGGSKPGWSRKTVESIWVQQLSNAETVVHIDIHTGLGSRGVGYLMMAADDDEPHHALMQQWFGDMLITPRPASHEDTVLGGYLNAGMEETLPATWVIPMTLEYGTESPDVVMRSLIEDNWLTHHGELDSDAGRDIKSRLLRAFYPACEDWKLAVIKRGIEVYSKALDGLGNINQNREAKI